MLCLLIRVVTNQVIVDWGSHPVSWKFLALKASVGLSVHSNMFERERERERERGRIASDLCTDTRKVLRLKLHFLRRLVELVGQIS